MKIILALLLAILPFSALAEDPDDAVIRQLYDLWYKAHKNQIDRWSPGGLECHKGGKASNPERDDPPYLSWKHYWMGITLEDQFTCGNAFVWMREHHLDLWNKLGDRGSSKLFCWARENLRLYEGNLTDITDGPPPEKWTSAGTDTAGRAVDKDGRICIGQPQWGKYFWLPLVLGLVAGVWVNIKCGSGGTIVCMLVIAAYAWGTDWEECLKCFLSAIVLAMMVLMFVVRLALSGLGIGKKES